MNTQHTRAPWTRSGNQIVSGPIEICTLEIDGNVLDEVKANARLIAAAPAMYAALEKLCSHEKFIVYTINQLGEASPAAFSLDCEKARALIAKIKGEA